MKRGFVKYVKHRLGPKKKKDCVTHSRPQLYVCKAVRGFRKINKATIVLVLNVIYVFASAFI